MGKIKSLMENHNQEIEIADGASIKDACKTLEVPFSCEEGVCASCKIEVVKGEENLSELTEPEKNLGCDRKNRLGCQAKLKSGDIEITYY